MKHIVLIVLIVAMESCSRNIYIDEIDQAKELCENNNGLYKIDTFLFNTAVCVKRQKGFKHIRIMK